MTRRDALIAAVRARIISEARRDAVVELGLVLLLTASSAVLAAAVFGPAGRLVAVLAGLTFGVVRAGRFRQPAPSPELAAALIDHRLGGRAVSSSLAASGAGAPCALLQRQVEQRLAQLGLEEILPPRRPPGLEAGLALAAVVLLIGLGLDQRPAAPASANRPSLWTDEGLVLAGGGDPEVFRKELGLASVRLAGTGPRAGDRSAPERAMSSGTRPDGGARELDPGRVRLTGPKTGVRDAGDPDAGSGPKDQGGDARRPGDQGSDSGGDGAGVSGSGAGRGAGEAQAGESGGGREGGRDGDSTGSGGEAATASGAGARRSAGGTATRRVLETLRRLRRRTRRGG